MAALTITRLVDSGFGPEWLARYLSRDANSAQQASQFKKKKIGYTSAVGPTNAYGADLIHADIYTIAASGTTTIDLTALADVAGVTRSFARIKAIWALLLGLDDNGAPLVQASSVTIGGNGSNGCLSFLANVSDKYTLVPGRKISVEDYSGTGLAVTASLKLIDLINADATNAAVLALAIAGSLS